MKDIIEIEIILDQAYKEPKVAIYTDRRTRETEQIIYAIENVRMASAPPILGEKDKLIVPVLQMDIFRAVVEHRITRLYCLDGEYLVRKKLSELETVFDPVRFVRISQSEIINLRRVKGFDLSIVGTIGVEFDDGSRSWVARRFVRQIRQRLAAVSMQGTDADRS